MPLSISCKQETTTFFSKLLLNNLTNTVKCCYLSVAIFILYSVAIMLLNMMLFKDNILLLNFVPKYSANIE